MIIGHGLTEIIHTCQVFKELGGEVVRIPTLSSPAREGESIQQEPPLP